MTNGPPRIFDAHAQALHRDRAARMTGERFLLHEAADGIAARLDPVNRTFGAALAVDGRAAALLQGIAPTWRIGLFDAGEQLDSGDGGFDLAVSILSLHGINDLPGALVQIRRALKPDGLFVAALFGGATLCELRDAFTSGEIETIGGITPRVTPFADVRELGALLQRAGFALPVADVERTCVLYRDFATLANDLRLMGETNALIKRQGLSRATLRASLAYYAAKHSDADGRLRATFDIVYLTGWSPHESQQKPLKPGNAKVRLAQALGTTEHSAGDKAKPRR
ncbi:MAG TPA: methyltransferase domain-containing protein [Rhizomicrobium sp.]